MTNPQTTTSLLRIGDFEIYGWKATAAFCGILIFQAVVFALIGYVVGKGWI